jgi:hypothetical protein
MNGPKRSHDELGDLGQTLLSAGRQEQPDPRALERTLSLLAATSAAATGSLVAGDALAAKAGTTGAGAGLSGMGAGVVVQKATLAVTLAKWLGTGALFGGLVVGGSQAWQILSKSTHVTPGQSSVPAPQASATPPGAPASQTGTVGAPHTSQSSFVALAEHESAASEQPAGTGAFEGAKRRTGPERVERTAVERTATGSTATGSTATGSTALGNTAKVALVAPLADAPQSEQPVADAPPSAWQAPPLGDSVATQSAGTTPAGSGAPLSSAPAAIAREPVRSVASAPDRLAEEVRFIDQARTQLANGNTAEALRVLDEYRARFSRASLGPEALYLRMEALWGSGRRDAALAVARRIVESSPNGPAARRAQELLQR